MADTLLNAYVLWWDINSIAVFCPLCSDVEVHGIQSRRGMSNWSEKFALKSLCSPQAQNYQAIFPWQKELGWQKNFATDRIDTVGLDLSDLYISGSWHPTSCSVSGPLLGSREQPQKRLNEPNHKERENAQQKGFVSTPRLAPRRVLGDMRLIVSSRPKPNRIEINAPGATVGGVTLSSPLAIMSSPHLLEKKTIAILYRGEPFDPIVALSGWRYSLQCSDNVLNQKIWTAQVRTLCEYVAHTLPAHNMDHGLNGQHFASHAEKQVIAFCIRMHCFLESGYETVYMEKLSSLAPRSRLREVTIAIDKWPCEDCAEYAKKVGAICGMKFNFVLMQTKQNQSNKDGVLEPAQVRPNAGNVQCLTPPSSGNLRSGGKFRSIWKERRDREYPENEDDDEDDWDDCDADIDPESPCQERALRSLYTGRSLSEDNATSLSPDLPKRPRIEIEDSVDDNSEYFPISSSTRRHLSFNKKSKTSSSFTEVSPDQPPTPPYISSPPTTPQKPQPGLPQQLQGLPKLSEAGKWAAISKIWESVESQKQAQSDSQQRALEDASEDSDVPVSASRRPRKKRENTEKLVIDLTGDD